jgi:hypothetical protein
MPPDFCLLSFFKRGIGLHSDKQVRKTPEAGKVSPGKAGGFSEAREREGERRSGTTVPVVERSMGEAAAVIPPLRDWRGGCGWLVGPRWDVALFWASLLKVGWDNFQEARPLDTRLQSTGT